MAILKTEPPRFDGGEGDGARALRLADFLAQHEQELEYVLSHLSGRNMNGYRFSVDVTDADGGVIGTLGYTGAGVGLSFGGASIEVRSDGIYLVSNGGSVKLEGTIDAGGESITNLADGTDSTDAATVGQLPTKTSELENDSGFITHALLWSNGDPSAVFAAQTISISGLSDYDAVMIEIAWKNNNRILRSSVTVGYESGVYACASIVDPDEQIEAVKRNFILQADGIRVSTGSYATPGDEISGAGYAIPIRIVGIKYAL